MRLAAARLDGGAGAGRLRLVAGFDLLETRARRNGKGPIGIGIEIGLEVGRTVAALDRVPKTLFNRIGGANRFAHRTDDELWRRRGFPDHLPVARGLGYGRSNPLEHLLERQSLDLCRLNQFDGKQVCLARCVTDDFSRGRWIDHGHA